MGTLLALRYKMKRKSDGRKLVVVMSMIELRITGDDGAFLPGEFTLAEQAQNAAEVLTCGNVDTSRTIIGFGAAFTESAAYVFGQMPPQLQDQFLQLAFAGATGSAIPGEGNAYTLCRVPIQSSDFSLGSYSFVKLFNRNLRLFSIARDKQMLLPFIRCCLAANPQIELVAAPWSPPAYMKTNLSMKYGGRLRKKYYGKWARVLANYLRVYEDEGVHISRMSVQNEPQARQTWESCLYTAEEEAVFARDHLKPAFEREGLTTKLMAWDHNKDLLEERVQATLGEAPGTFDSIAFHWYTGDYFEAVRTVADTYPDVDLIHTEGCEAYKADWRSDLADSRAKAEHYAHDIIGDLNAGTQGYIDWNVLLDEQGGPNHVGNYCEAPLMYDRTSKELIINRSFNYIGHFSRYIRPGACRVELLGVMGNLECTCFQNPDGTHALVALNRNRNASTLRLQAPQGVVVAEIPAHSIATLTW